jgi:raffinose/stachyose/melibiose transport system permease protein
VCSPGWCSRPPSCRRSSFAFLLQRLGLYNTQFGWILVEAALGMAVAILVFRAFVGTISKQIDEAAIMDGASLPGVFFSIVLPLLRPAIVTVIVTSSVGIYNDYSR